MANKWIPLAGLGALGALMLLSRKAKAGAMRTPAPTRNQFPDTMGPRRVPPVKLGPNFNTSEFIKPPNKRGAKLTDKEIRNATLLVSQILQPTRNKFGPIKVTGGFRLLTTMTPQQWVKYLVDKGYHTASLSSDHFEARGVDIYPMAAAKDRGKFLEVARFMARLPQTRQIIVYYKTDKKTGETVPGHIHVSVVTPDRKRFKGKKFAMMYHKGKPLSGGYSAIMD